MQKNKCLQGAAQEAEQDLESQPGEEQQPVSKNQLKKLRKQQRYGATKCFSNQHGSCHMPRGYLGMAACSTLSLLKASKLAAGEGREPERHCVLVLTDMRNRSGSVVRQRRRHGKPSSSSGGRRWVVGVPYCR